MQNEELNPMDEEGKVNVVDNSRADSQVDVTSEGSGVDQGPGEEIQAEPNEGDSTVRHVEYVQKLALKLFDGTRKLHELTDNCRQVLAEAARYHCISLPRGKKKAKRAAIKFVEAQSDEELSEEDRKVLVAVLVLLHGKLKQKWIEALDLDPTQQRDVLTLLAILLIAMGLDESRTQSTVIKQMEPTKNKMWIVVDGPEARTDAAAAKYNASVWERVGYPKVKILESGKAQDKLLPYPSVTGRPGLSANDDMAEAGRKIFRFYFAQMLSFEEGARSGVEIEDLHHMRVATRRMRAAFDVFGDAYKSQLIKPYIKGLRRTARVLGKVRDLDVFIDKAQKYLEALPEDQRQGLEPLLDVWYEQRDQARADLIVYLDSDTYQRFKRKFNIFINTPGVGVQLPPHNVPQPNLVKEIAPILIYTRLAAARAFEPLLEDASIETLHALRIEMKKFRYTIEFFREVLGEEAFAIINEMKAMQDHLGALNDAKVASQSIQNFIDRWDIHQEDLPISERQNPEAVVTYLASRHAELYQLSVDFKDAWRRFDHPAFRRNLALAISVL